MDIRKHCDKICFKIKIKLHVFKDNTTHILFSSAKSDNHYIIIKYIRHNTMKSRI